MPVPNILAGTASGTTAQLDANFSYLSALVENLGSAITVSSGSVGIGGSPLVPFHVRAASSVLAMLTRSSDVTVNGASGVEMELGALSGATPVSAATMGAVLDNPATAGYLYLKTLTGGVLTEKLRVDTSGNMTVMVPATPPGLVTNRTMVMNLTSDTNLRISVRGSDGVTRAANITLA